MYDDDFNAVTSQIICEEYTGHNWVFIGLNLFECSLCGAEIFEHDLDDDEKEEFDEYY